MLRLLPTICACPKQPGLWYFIKQTLAEGVYCLATGSTCHIGGASAGACSGLIPSFTS
jgi:hypothetical protein